MANLLEIKDASLAISGKKLFENFNLKLKKGEIAMVIGPSGSGKSSLFRMILELTPSEEGWSTSGSLKLASRPGWVSQNPSWDLMGNWVREEVGLKELSLFGVADLYDKKSSELSHGEKTIAVLAAAFSRDILLLDEPGVCLSAFNLRRLKKLLVSENKTALIIEHTPEFIDIADRFYRFESAEAEEINRDEAVEYLSDLPDYNRPQIFGPPILEVNGEVALKLSGGACVGISGDNGSGKTRFLSALAGVDNRLDITCHWMGRRLKNIKNRRGIISFVPQEPGRYLLENTLGNQAREWSLNDDELRRFNLMGDQSRRIDSLSGGEKQRLALAGAFSAPVLLLDEPTYGLDRNSMESLFAGIREKCERGGIVFISSHDRRILKKLATEELRFAA